jgi:hypothetical protein
VHHFIDNLLEDSQDSDIALILLVWEFTYSVVVLPHHWDDDFARDLHHTTYIINNL